MKEEPLQKERPKKDHHKQFQQPKIRVNKNRYYDLLGLAVIILLGIIIYSNSFNCSFHFDDLSNIVDNPKIKNLSDISAWWNFVPSRPIGNFTFALNYHFNQLNVTYWHVVNLVIHLINACLVWWLTRLILSTPAMKGHPIVKKKEVVALFAALLFVSHPLATQAVTYIVQRLATLVAMFYLFSLILYVKARLTIKGNRSKYFLFAGSLLSAILAMMTKENAFTLPFAIVLFEIFFLRTKKVSINFKDYRLILLTAAFVGIIGIIPLKFSFSIFQPIPPQQGHLYTVTPLNYLFTEFSVIIKYIQLLFFPISQHLDYDFPLSTGFFNVRTVISFLVLLSILLLAVLLFKTQRLISFGIFWFFLTLLVESSIIPIPNVIFEHRTYLPSVGFCIAVTGALFIIFRGQTWWLAVSIMGLMIIVNSFLTYERNKVWKDDLSLWSDNVAKAPNIARPIRNRGVAYGELGQWDKAIADFSKAIEIDPKFIKAWFNRGITYGKLGQWDESVADYSRVIGINPKHVLAYINRGLAYGELSQWDKAIADYSSGIGINPKYTDAYNNRGVAYSNLGQWDKAITDYSKTIEINPKHAIAFNNRGLAYGELGQWDKAIADYSRAIDVNPKYTDAYNNRGIAYGNLGQWDQVITDFSKVIEIDPKHAITYTNRGIAYGKLGQWAKAIADYSKAIEIDPNFTTAFSNRDFASRKLASEKKQ